MPTDDIEKLKTCIVMLNECVKALVTHAREQDERITLILESIQHILNN